MSRIGKLPISIPESVNVSIQDNVITVKGPKGTLSQVVDARIRLEISDGNICVMRMHETQEERALHGLYRSLIKNMVVGVSEGYKRTLELIGVGYRAASSGQILELSLGYTHPIFLQLPTEVLVEAKMERNKAPIIILESADKQLLGQVCAKIRSFRKPEPYKGKGIRFEGEYIRRKSGKTAGK